MSQHWMLYGAVRVTQNDGPATLIDLPIFAAFDGLYEVKSGTINAKRDVLPGVLAVSPCAQVEILRLHLVDPGLSRFATIGSSTR